MQNISQLKSPYNENIIKKLEDIINNNKLSNAYIFYGPEGIGKKEVAFEFINQLMNINKSELNSEKKIRENNHPDFAHIQPTYLQKGNLINQSELASENKQNSLPIIRIDQIRDIRNFISKKCMQSERKIVLIDDAHLLNESASNCLLKTLEEPTNGLFILLTSKMNLLLDTIISRCQKIRFQTLSNHQLKEFFKQNIKSTHGLEQNIINIEELIYLSNGSPGKLVKNIKLWNTIPDNIKEKISYPIKEFSDAIILSKSIYEQLDLIQQDLLINFIQLTWWQKIKSKEIIQIMEELKLNLIRNIQPRLSWEVSLIKVKMIIYP